MIASNYIKGWLTVDILTIVPFNLITPSTYTVKDALGLVRIGRLYRLMRLARLMRALKFIYKENSFIKRIVSHFKIGAGKRRLLLLIVILLIF